MLINTAFSAFTLSKMGLYTKIILCQINFFFFLHLFQYKIFMKFYYQSLVLKSEGRKFDS